MKILYIASKTPFPIYDGGAFAAFSFIKQLHEIANVDGIIVSTHKHPFTSESKATLLPFFKRLTNQFMDTKVKPFDALRALIKGENYNLKRFQSSELKAIIQEHLAINQYDWIVCDSVFAAATLNDLDTSVKIAIRSHNVEHLIWENLRKSCSNPIKKFYLAKLASSLKQEEIQLLKKAELVFTITREDELVFKKHIPSGQFITLPVVVDSPDFPLEETKPEVFHLGSMDWLPNQEAVDFLFRLFTTSQLLRQTRLNIAGKSLNKELYKSPMICNYGEIDNSAEFMRNSGILVAPIFSGSGVRIKLLEALSIGIPVITTELGASGIDLKSSGIVLAKTAEDFEQAILALISNKQLRNELGKKGFSYIRNEHSLNQAKAILAKAFDR